MVDEVIGPGSEVRARTPHGINGADGHLAAPHGFSVRYHPADLTGHWHDVVTLGEGRTGVLVGCCTDAASTSRLRSVARTALLQTADPVQSLSGVTGSGVSALCAVIDGVSIGYSSRGGSNTAVADPDNSPQVLNDAEGRLVVAPLRPGATVLLCTGRIGQAATALDSCE